MFDRFLRFQKAKLALAAARHEEAIRLAGDPAIADDRRAAQIRDAARAGLLQRAKQRLEKGELEAAVRDFERAALAGADAAVADGLVEAKRRILERDAAQRTQRDADARIRRLVERGELDEAAAALTACRDALPAELANGLERVLDVARRRAAEVFAEQTARAEQAAPEAAREAMRLLEEGDCAAALRRLCAASAIAAIAQSRPARDAFAAAGERARALLRDGPEVPDAELVGALAAAAVAAGDAAPAPLQQASSAAARLVRVPGLRAAGRFGELEAALREAGEAIGSEKLAAAASEVRAAQARADQCVDAALRHFGDGRLDEARAELLCALEIAPSYDRARAESSLLERSVLERSQRLEQARRLAAEGMLQQALAVALADAQPGVAGSAAAALVADLRARVATVDRGHAEVLAAAHGKACASVAALRALAARCEELLALQLDHATLPAVRAALLAEVAALEAVERALANDDLAELSAAVDAIVARRGELLAKSRLDARLCEVASRLSQAADRALLAGRLGDAKACAAAIERAAAHGAQCGEAAGRIHASCAFRQQNAEALAQSALRCAREGDLEGSAERVEEARRHWSDGGVVRAVERELGAIRRREASLKRAAGFADAGEASMARAEIAAMGETPPLLRTRIFDMKRSIARAQGLDGAFVLRVDEGGEFLVLRGDSITIGNLRDGTADLPILCALAGRHARIERSMSFHGGMQDTIVAENGDVQVNGASTQKQALRSGDRVRLGSSLQLGYSMPCSRSLTAMLHLLAGFQVAGTDRALLLKDRGRDGRICIGPGKDVHVRVEAATAEVELFVSKTGQLRLRCSAGGEVDGVRFEDERPVDAGAMVRAGGVSFVLAPWSPRG